MTQKMYALCTNNLYTDLEKGKEYEVVKVKAFSGFGEKCFFVLADGLAYSSIHFSVIYIK